MNIKTGIINERIDDRVGFIGKTYGMLTLCVILASIGSYFSMDWMFPKEHPWMMLFISIGFIVLVNYTRKIPYINMFMLISFGIISGIMISPLVNMVAQNSGIIVAQAFFTTAVTFLSLTSYVFISKKDFSFLKGFVWVGLAGVIIAGFSNYFIFESTGFSMLISSMSVVLFSFFILYDTSKILREYPDDEYISAALTLYLDVFLLFQNLLSLLNNLED